MRDSKNSASADYSHDKLTPDEFRNEAVGLGLLTTDWRQKIGDSSKTGMDMYMEYANSGLKMTNPQWGDGTERVLAETLNDCAWGVFRDWGEYSSWLAAAMKVSRSKIRSASSKL